MGQSTTQVQRSNMSMFLVVFLMPLCLGSPLEGFGDATDAEIAEIRGGTYLEGFDENPQYNFNYKVADDLEQTYISMDEARDGENVRGSYSYVDPLGSLITVTYTAGSEGYQETREIQDNFITINQRPATRATVSVDILANSRLQAQRGQAARLDVQRAEASRLEAQRVQAARIEAQRAEAARLEAQRTESSRLVSSQQNRADLIAQIVSQISSQVPSIIASSMSGSNRAVQEQQVSASSTVTDRFGSSGTHTVSLNTPDVQVSYEHDSYGN